LDALADCIRVILPILRAEPTKYFHIARAAAAHTNVVVVRAAASTLFYLNPANVTENEIQLSEMLASHPDFWVRQNVLHGLRWLAKDEGFRSRGIQLALKVEISPPETRVAEDFSEIFGSYGVGKHVRLSVDQVKSVLEKLLVVNSIEGYHTEQLLVLWSDMYPEEVFGFFLRRVRVAVQRRADEDWSYQAIPHDISLKQLAASRYAENVALLMDLFVETNRDTDVGHLFWAISALDDTVITILNQYIDADDPLKLNAVIAVLDYGPHQIAFSHPQFVRQLLESASRIGSEYQERATGQLIANAIPRMITGSMEGPPPALVRMRERALSLMADYTSDIRMSDLYRRIRDQADAQIRQMQASAADFRFQHS
jgi:hypothetical protein